MTIYENTYSNLYHITDTIYKNIIVPFYSNEDKELVKDVSTIFESKEIKVFLILEKRVPFVNETRGVTVNDKTNKELSIILISKKLPGSISTLRHEVTHVLDYIRSGQKMRKQKKGYFSSFDSYMLDTAEFNEFIHNYKNMFDLIQVNKDRISPTILHLFHKAKNKESFLQLAGEAFNPVVERAIKNNNHLYRKIIERLAREKILPPNFNT